MHVSENRHWRILFVWIKTSILLPQPLQSTSIPQIYPFPPLLWSGYLPAFATEQTRRLQTQQGVFTCCYELLYDYIIVLEKLLLLYDYIRVLEKLLRLYDYSIVLEKQLWWYIL